MSFKGTDSDSKHPLLKGASLSASSKHIDIIPHELTLCQCLCANCHYSKTYLENPLRHRKTRHETIPASFIDAYLRNIGSNEKVSQEELDRRQKLYDSPRSKTDEFVFIDSDLTNSESEDESAPQHSDQLSIESGSIDTEMSGNEAETHEDEVDTPENTGE